MQDAETFWNVFKGDRRDCVPDDVYNKDFWNLADSIQWEAALIVFAWAKETRSKVTSRWTEAWALCRGFNRRFNRKLVWPDDDVEEAFEDLMSILEPLSNMDRFDEEDGLLLGTTGGISLQVMD